MNERLKKIIDYYGFNTTSFSKKCGISEGTIRKIIQENTTIRSDNLLKISQNFTQVNLDWLLVGRGEMLLSNDENISFEKLFETNQQLNQRIGALQNEVEHLQQTIKELKKQLAPTSADAATPSSVAI